MRLEVAVTTCPPRNARAVLLLNKISARTHAATVRLYNDPDRRGIAWNSARAFANVDRSCSHVLFLEDDILVCSDFLPTVKRLVEVNPDAVISLFGTHGAIEKAYNAYDAWTTRTSIGWNQAVLMPTELANAIYLWSLDHVGPTKWAEPKTSLFCLVHKRPIWYTVPCLVEHELPGESLLGNHKTIGGRERKATRFIGEQVSGLTVDWTRGLQDPIHTTGHATSAYPEYIP